LFWEQDNAMAAWQDTIVPPPARVRAESPTRKLGRQVFEKAGCVSCHAGPFLTNNQVISSASLGVNPVRSQALQKTEQNFTQPPVVYSFDTGVPLPPGRRSLNVPIGHLNSSQIDLAWAHHGSGGGYKVPSLVGLYWSAPYLHDGGVAAGKNLDSELGIPGTVDKNVMPDSANSLKALLDRDLRARVVRANEASTDLQRMNVQGVGHNYWVDSGSGFSNEEQQALILYLLSYSREQ
jgi:hypothetical protein